MHDGQEDAEQIIDTTSRPFKQPELSTEQLQAIEENKRKAMERKRLSALVEASEQKRPKVEETNNNFSVVYTDNAAGMDDVLSDNDMDDLDIADCMDY